MTHHFYSLLSLSLSPAPALLIHHQDSPPLLPCLAPDLTTAWTLVTKQYNQIRGESLSLYHAVTLLCKSRDLRRLQPANGLPSYLVPD